MPKPHRLLTVFTLIFPVLMLSQPILITEVSPAGSNFFLDEDGDTSDWIEIKNVSDESIELKGYWLSDDATKLNKWMFPKFYLEPDSHLVIFCSGKNRSQAPFHSSFKIKSSGEPIYLSNVKSACVDSVRAVSISKGFSFSRICTDTCYWQTIAKPTPGEDNLSQGIVTFSKPSCVSADEVELILSSTLNHQIRYTLDGTTPNLNSKVYSNTLTLQDASKSNRTIARIPTSPSWSVPPGKIPKVQVVRACTYKDSVRTSQVVTMTYAIGPEIKKLFERYVVISLQAEIEDFFGDERGIYVPGVHFDSTNVNWSGNYYEHGPNWERSIHLEYFENAKPMWAQQLGVRIHGGITRGMPQKSLRFYARDSLGAGKINYPLFETKDKHIFDKIVLRSQMGCWSRTIIRDELTSYIVKDLNVETQHTRPCLVFINGEYWGFHTIRDYLDANHFEESYGLNKDSINILNPGSGIRPDMEEGWGVFEGTNKEYIALTNYISSVDMSLPSSYEFVSTQIDMSSMVDYFCAQIYFAQNDWPAGNHKIWNGGQGTKWKWILFDSDASWGYFGPDYPAIRRATATSGKGSNPPWATWLFRKMLESPIFFEHFRKRYADLILDEFSHERIEPIIDKTVSLYYPEMKRNLDRWRKLGSLEDWNEAVKTTLYDFGRSRKEYAIKHFEDFFKTPLELDSSNHK